MNVEITQIPYDIETTEIAIVKQIMALYTNLLIEVIYDI